MRTDRRATQRHGLRGVAKIQSRAGGLRRDCIVTDVSDGGVRLYAEGADVSAEFTLWFANDRTRRDCRVVWRLGNEIGAEFADVAQGGFAVRMTG